MSILDNLLSQTAVTTSATEEPENRVAKAVSPQPTQSPEAPNNRIAGLLAEKQTEPNQTVAKSSEQIILAKLIKAIAKEHPRVDTEALKTKANSVATLVSPEFISSLTNDNLKNSAIASEMVRELSSIASNTLNNGNTELVNLALDSLQKLALQPCPETATMLEKTLIRSATQELTRIAFNQRHFGEGGGSTEASLEHTEFLEARAKNIISAIPEQNLHFAIEAMVGYSVFRTSLHKEFSTLLTKALQNPASAVPALFSVVKELNHLLSKATGEHRWGSSEKLTSDETASLEMVASAITAANIPENRHAQHLLTQINTALEQAKPAEATSENSVLTKLATGLGTTVEALLESLKAMVANKKISAEVANPNLN